MKAIILVLSPEECCNLFNGDLSILVRKKFPKDYVGWVYIYCTKKAPYGVVSIKWDNEHDMLGKVVAKVWCSKVEKLIDRDTKEKNHYSLGTETLQIDELEKMSCLTIRELVKYIGKGTEWQYGKYGYAIHITNLEIFDKPKNINEFEKLGSFLNPTVKCPKKDKGRCNEGISEFTGNWCGCERAKLTQAPRNGWGYVEI